MYTANNGQQFNSKAEAFQAGVDVRTLKWTGDTSEPGTVTVSTSWSDTSVSQARAQRIEDSIDFLKSKGWAANVPSTIFPPATNMLAQGVNTFRSKAQLHGDQPAMREGFMPAIEAIEGEHRRNYRVDAAKLRMTDDGRLYSTDKGPANALPVEPQAFYSLLSRFGSSTDGLRHALFPKARSFMNAMSPELRADVFNRQIVRAQSFGHTEEDRAVNLGIRTIGDQLQVYRAVSPSYLDMPVDKILRAYIREFEAMGLPDPRGVVDYDPSSTIATWRASWHAPQTFDAGVGDIFEVGINGRSGDIGNSAHHGGLGFTRIVCINCTIAEWLEGQVARRHRGSKTANPQESLRAGLARVRQDVASLANSAEVAGEHFLRDWGVLTDTPAAKVVKGNSAEEMMTSAHKLIKRLDAQTARDVTVEMLLEGFAAEPGDRLVDVVNAVSRAAHSDLLDAIQRDRAERTSGALLKLAAKTAVARA